jgi:hypothetical protein
MSLMRMIECTDGKIMLVDKLLAHLDFPDLQLFLI